MAKPTRFILNGEDVTAQVNASVGSPSLATNPDNAARAATFNDMARQTSGVDYQGLAQTAKGVKANSAYYGYGGKMQSPGAVEAGGPSFTPPGMPGANRLTGNANRPWETELKKAVDKIAGEAQKRKEGFGWKAGA